MVKVMKVNNVGILKKFIVVALVCNFLVLGSAFIKPLRVSLYAEGEIDAGNTKSIFINTAFVVMGALGLKIVASANGLASDFANSLGDMFDSWTAVGSIPLATITSALQNRLNVQGQNLVIGGELYNQIINFLNYCGGAVSSGVTSIFNTPTPAFIYNEPGNYYVFGVGSQILGYSISGSSGRSEYFTVLSQSSEVRCAIFNSSLLFIASASDFVLNVLRVPNSGSSSSSTASLSSSNGFKYYLVNAGSRAVYNNIFPIINNIDSNVNQYLYYLFGAGAVAGTDGTISIPDPISRNYNDVNSKPFTGVGENDDVPIAIPGSFATDYPLTGTWDIPDSLPFAIPWVLDVPSALDTPIDIPWYPDPIGNIPAPTIPAPPSLTDVPLIITPECESLSACLIQGVSTVSNHISQFINIHEEFRNYTIITLLIGFALFILGVFA